MSAWNAKPPVDIPADYKPADEVGIDLAALFLIKFIECHHDCDTRPLAQDVLDLLNIHGYGFMHCVVIFIEFYAFHDPNPDVRKQGRRVLEVLHEEGFYQN